MLVDDKVITKQGLAKMLKGGVIMDIVNKDQAIVAERAGAVAVMVLERVPSDILKYGGVARMCNPEMITKIQSTVKIPVMAKVRIGHSMEAKILQQLKVDFIDESEVLTLTDPLLISKTEFSVPFVSGCKGLKEALRRIEEGASMIRTKGQAGTGNVAEAVKHARALNSEIKQLRALNDLELEMYAKRIDVSFDLVKEVSAIGRLPVVTFAAGGIATPVDAALLMQLGMDGVFVGSGIFKSENPEKLAKAIVHSVAHYNEPEIILKASYGTGSAMNGIVLPAQY